MTCFIHPKLKSKYACLKSVKDLGLVHCGYHHIDSKGNRTELVSFLPEGKLLEQLLKWGFYLVRRPAHPSRLP
jgi:hypothetical protein